ncbi:MAG: biotin/lipoate A/B protein ligase family protein [Gemmataceae bacterium]
MLTQLANAEWSWIPEHAMLPAEHVALDEVLTTEVATGQRPPTLRFWAWAAPAVIIGRFQSLKNEVDEVAAQTMGVTVVRRMSGGGAMFVQPGSTITYSMYLPDSLVQGISIRDSYETLDRWCVEVFRELGVAAEHKPLNDIASPEGKIGGAAQVRRPGVVLHHTTIAYEMNADEMMSVLRIGREKVSDKGIPSAAKRVSPLRRQTDLPRETIVEKLVAGFRSRFGLVESGLSQAAIASAKELVASKYGCDEWTRDLP